MSRRAAQLRVADLLAGQLSRRGAAAIRSRRSSSGAATRSLGTVALMCFSKLLQLLAIQLHGLLDEPCLPSLPRPGHEEHGGQPHDGRNEVQPPAVSERRFPRPSLPLVAVVPWRPARRMRRPLDPHRRGGLLSDAEFPGCYWSDPAVDSHHLWTTAELTLVNGRGREPDRHLSGMAGVQLGRRHQAVGPSARVTSALGVDPARH